MTLPDEAAARTDLARLHRDLFDRAERVHNAAVEVVTRGKFTISKTEGFHGGVFLLIASLLTKACKTYRAIQIVAESGLGQDASVLARQLFEVTVAVGFILQRDSRVRAAMFAAHEDQRMLVLVEEAAKIGGFKSASEENLDKARAKVRAWDELIGHSEVESVRRHWSGRGLKWAAKEVGLLDAYAMMYRYTSAFAHGSDVSAHFFVKNGDTTPTLKLAPGDDQVQAVLNSSMTLMRIIVGTINDAFGLGEEQVLERIGAELR